ncbi:MAG: ribonuclease J [Desulfoplanes sp.]|nr:ribonuclease J [Desulfoplanes sp.]MDD4648604.1 ribonuclease J [Desulfoplanes sp.]
MAEPYVTLTPLGGLGEIGMNCMALETADSMVLVDCGLMFPDDYLLGVDVVIPCLDFIIERKEKLKGIVLTHGHEDHIGALPWLMQRVNVPLYSSEFTLALIRRKLEEHGLAETTTFCPVKGRDTVELGDFTFHFFRVCHSIIEGFGLGIETPIGKIVHTGDFKIDRNPMDGHATDLDAFRDFSQDGVTLMCSDSTNVEREGFALTEREIKASLNNIVQRAPGRILVTLFSSHIQRIQEIFDLAEKFGKKVAVSGKSIASNIEIAKELGHLHFSQKNYCELEDLPGLQDSETVLILTGSQGEPLSALSRLSRGEHRQLNVHQGDTVIMSSRFIPGNTKAITKVINDLYRLGAEVLYKKVQAIHASGHAHKEELRIMFNTVHPKFFIPIHGEYRHLLMHTKLARECGVAPERTIIREDGQPVTFFKDSIRLEETIKAESLLVDGKGVGDVGQTVIKERQILGGEGLVIVVLVVDPNDRGIVLGPQILSKGFIFEQHLSHILEDAKEIVLDVYENIDPRDTKKLKERIRSSLRRFFKKILGRDPIVVPLVIDISQDDK